MFEQAFGKLVLYIILLFLLCGKVVKLLYVFKGEIFKPLVLVDERYKLKYIKKVNYILHNLLFGYIFEIIGVREIIHHIFSFKNSVNFIEREFLLLHAFIYIGF